MIVRVRLGLLLAPISATQQLTLELPDRATIEDLCGQVAAERPDHAAVCHPRARSFLNAEQVGRAHALRDGDEDTPTLPMVGG